MPKALAAFNAGYKTPQIDRLALVQEQIGAIQEACGESPTMCKETEKKRE